MRQKFSPEVRLEMINLYLSGKWSLKSICREFQINENVLRDLIENYRAYGSQALHRKPTCKVTDDLKRQIICEFEQKTLTLQQIRTKYHMSRNMLTCWKRAYNQHGAAGIWAIKPQGKGGGRPRKNMGRPKKINREPQTELERLRAENLELRLENALLKKVKALVEEREARQREIGRKPSTN